MRVLILGAGGMLGHQLCRTLGDQFEFWGTNLGRAWPTGSTSM